MSEDANMNAEDEKITEGPAKVKSKPEAPESDDSLSYAQYMDKLKRPPIAPQAAMANLPTPISIPEGDGAVSTLSTAKPVEAPATAEKQPKKAKSKKTKADSANAKGTKMNVTTEGKKVLKKAKAQKTVKPKKDKVDSWAQSGQPLKLALQDLNDKEKLVLKSLTGIDDEIPPKAIAELAAQTFPDLDPAKANSWTRNALRRLVLGKLAQKVERGAYRASKKGAEALVTAALGPIAKN